jgi:predicted PurR-regulated permease PerM
MSGVLGYLTSAVAAFLQLFGTFFVAIYLLADLQRFQATFLKAVPMRYRADADVLWNELGTSLSRYLTGVLISLAIQGTLAYFALSLLGVPYAFLLGLWTAATGVLPYIGAYLAAIPAIGLALFISPWTAGLTALAYLVINQIEGNLLTPRIQGEAVRVHPLIVFLAVLAGGEVAGLPGAALAVPAVAVVRVLAGFFAARLHVQQKTAT